jgi:drug/metabolite transporter (DMT)-like permease
MIWGAAAPIFKWTLQDNIQPFTFAFLRFTLAALILFPFAAHRLKIHKKDIPLLIFTGAIGMAFQIAYLFMGLRLTASINAPIISSAAPVFLILGSMLFLHEKPKKKVLRGTAISLIGIAIIILRPIFEQGLDSSILGNLFFIVSMILSVIYTLLLKEIAAKYNAFTLTFWIFAIAAITLSPLVLYEVSKTPTLFVPDTRTALGILFGGLLCSAGAYALHAFGVKYIAANETGIFSYVDPVVALIVAKPLLGESLTATFTVGAVLVFLGIFISEGRLHYHPLHLLFRKRQPQLTVPPALAPTIVHQSHPHLHQEPQT